MSSWEQLETLLLVWCLNGKKIITNPRYTYNFLKYFFVFIITLTIFIETEQSFFSTFVLKWNCSKCWLCHIFNWVASFFIAFKQLNNWLKMLLQNVLLIDTLIPMPSQIYHAFICIYNSFRSGFDFYHTTMYVLVRFLEAIIINKWWFGFDAVINFVKVLLKNHMVKMKLIAKRKVSFTYSLTLASLIPFWFCPFCCNIRTLKRTINNANNKNKRAEKMWVNKFGKVCASFYLCLSKLNFPITMLLSPYTASPLPHPFAFSHIFST